MFAILLFIMGSVPEINLQNYWIGNQAMSANYVVSNTNDSGPGSFRAALLQANASLGPDNITFNIPGAGPYILTPLLDLPILMDDGTTIDATTQGSKIIIDGNNGITSLTAMGNNCSISGFHFRNFTSNDPCIEVNGDNTTIANCLFTQLLDLGGIRYSGVNIGLIANNFIGVDETGELDVSGDTDFGIAIVSSTQITIQNNVLSGHNTHSSSVGITLFQSDNCLIQNNRIGTNNGGMLAVPNSVGIEFDKCDNNQIINNIISGNTVQGIFIWNNPFT